MKRLLPPLVLAAVLVAPPADAGRFMRGVRVAAPAGGVVPSSPVFLTLSGSTAGQQTATWVAPDTLADGNAISGGPVTSYKVYRRIGADIPFDLSAYDAVTTVSAPTVTTNITGLTTGTSLRVRVTAVNASGEGDPSPQESATVP